jgi:hypothetical protein
MTTRLTTKGEISFENIGLIDRCYRENVAKFDVKRDNELIAAGTHFWCHACQVARPLASKSPDERYCQGCFDVLTYEAGLLPPKSRKPAWIPKARDAAPTIPVMPVTVNQQSVEAVTIPPDRGLIGGEAVTGDVTEKIKKLAGQGKSTRDIAELLKAEGINISHMTIARRLKGVTISIMAQYDVDSHGQRVRKIQRLSVNTPLEI